ncbi:MAG: Mpo1-like protein [Pseudomonadota bacterium]
MKNLQQWCDEYAVCHQNKTNKIFHYVCVPAIFWSVLAILWWLPFPSALQFYPYVNWCTLFMVPALAFYTLLSIPLGLIMLAISSLCCATFVMIQQSWGNQALIVSAISIFVVAWIGQFIGHHYEGKKPAFFKDVQFLLIGPIWVIVALKNKKS